MVSLAPAFSAGFVSAGLSASPLLPDDAPLLEELLELAGLPDADFSALLEELALEAPAEVELLALDEAVPPLAVLLAMGALPVLDAPGVADALAAADPPKLLEVPKLLLAGLSVLEGLVEVPAPGVTCGVATTGAELPPKLPSEPPMV